MCTNPTVDNQDAFTTLYHDAHWLHQLNYYWMPHKWCFLHQWTKFINITEMRVHETPLGYGNFISCHQDFPPMFFWPPSSPNKNVLIKDLNGLLFLPYVYSDLRSNFARTFGGNTNKKCWKGLGKDLDLSNLAIWSMQQENLSDWISLTRQQITVRHQNQREDTATQTFLYYFAFKMILCFYSHWKL